MLVYRNCRKSSMKSFLLVFRQALRRKMILGLLALAMLELVGGGGLSLLLLLSPLCTYATSKCSLSAGTASYSEATTNYNPQVPVQNHRIPDINLVSPAQRLHIPKSHVSAPTEAKRIDPTPTPTATIRRRIAGRSARPCREPSTAPPRRRSMTAPS